MSRIRVHISNLNLTYKALKGEGVEAIEDVSFDVRENDFISIIGPSGCGKSTLLKVVSGLLRPTRGEVIVDEEEAQIARRKAIFGFVFQDAVLLPWKTALENVSLPLKILHRIDKNHKKAIDLLKLVGLSGFEHKFPHELSGGMQQRVAIARALVFDPSILLMDEPFGALDEITRERMNIDLLRIWDQAKKTVLFVTHSVPEAVFLSARMIVLSERPARIKRVIDVKLPYPRSKEVRLSRNYFQLVNEGRVALGMA